jgi:hypothetical protein
MNELNFAAEPTELMRQVFFLGLPVSKLSNG